ncbi:MAG: acyl carrier protein [Eubacteriales bacterium]|nr:acyl carrier protein [Eubacteriales bacterium]
MFEQVKTIIEQYIDCRGVELTPETGLLTELNINSLDLVELVCAFEVAFDIEVPEKDIRKFSKVKDIMAYLEKSR